MQSGKPLIPGLANVQVLEFRWCSIWMPFRASSYDQPCSAPRGDLEPEPHGCARSRGLHPDRIARQSARDDLRREMSQTSQLVRDGSDFPVESSLTGKRRSSLCVLISRYSMRTSSFVSIKTWCPWRPELQVWGWRFCVFNLHFCLFFSWILLYIKKSDLLRGKKFSYGFFTLVEMRKKIPACWNQ